jgi:predicted nucleic acid-binding protein
VPVICLYEVFKKVNVVGSEAQALQAVAQMKQGHVIDLTEDVALSAALVSLKHNLPMADSLILATALSQDAVLWTQDAHFQGLPNVNFKEARTGQSGQRGKPRA